MVVLQEVVEKVLSIVREKTGIVIKKDRKIDMEIVLKSRFEKTGLSDDGYVAFFESSRDEIVLVASQFTIQETSFYRYREHFDRLKYEILPEIITDNPSRRITILSAGCATGEEPYTIAMLINELLPYRDGWNVRIIATDIYNNALDAARKGVFSPYKLRNIDDYYRTRYFTNEIKNSQIFYHINEDIKSMVEWRHCNLIHEPFALDDLRDVDVIFCENVIIYFQMDSIRRLINNFYSILSEGGILFLGYSETLNFIENDYVLSWWNNSFAYRKIIKSGKNESAMRGNKAGSNEILPDLFEFATYDEILGNIVKNSEHAQFAECAPCFAALGRFQFEYTVEYFMLKAEYHFNFQDYILALDECRKAIKLNPYLLDAHICMILLYIRMGMRENAEFEMRTALYMQPDCVMALYAAGLYYSKKGDAAKSNEYLSVAKKKLIESAGKFNFTNFPRNKYLLQKIRSDIQIGRIT